MFHTDLNKHIMQCSATAALQAKTMTDRDATPEELAEQDAEKIQRAKDLLMGSAIALEALSEGLGDSYFTGVGMMALCDHEDVATQIAVGRKVLLTIRDYALRCAGDV